MSRNKEKSQSVLSRYYASQSPISSDRPTKVDSVDDLSQAEVYRRMCIGEIRRDLSQVADPLQSLASVRDINDRLNHLMGEKHAWEHRIRQLGGPNYNDDLVANATVIKGHRYYGRAKELPDVKALIELEQHNERERSARKNQKAVLASVNATEFTESYYGYDGDDGFKLPSDTELLKQAETPPERSDGDIEARIVALRKAELLARLN